MSKTEDAQAALVSERARLLAMLEANVSRWTDPAYIESITHQIEELDRQIKFEVY